MKAILRFTAWATLAFVLAWFIAHPYQRFIAGLAGRIASPEGTEIEWLELDIFFPYDMSIFLALCLASNWVGWRARIRSAAIGLPVLFALELVTLVAAMKVLLASMGQPTDKAEAMGRLAVGMIRLTGLIAAGGTWAYLLGWEQLPQLANALASRNRAARGGKR